MNSTPCSECGKPGWGRWTVTPIDEYQVRYQVICYCEPCWALFILAGGQGLGRDDD